MKKSLLWMMVVLVSVSMVGVFSFAGCKGALEEAVTEAVEEVAEEIEEAVEEVVEEEAPAEEAPEEAEAIIDEIVVGMHGDNLTLDIQVEAGAVGMYMKQLLYNGLVGLSQDLDIVPSLAESWDISDNGLDYTFYLKKGVMFHNGREMVADDVKFSIERMADPELGSPWIGDVAVITNIEIIDDYTVKLSLGESFAPFLYNIASGWRPIVAKESYNEDNTIDNPIGTGPYKFVEWIPDDKFVIEVFEDYWAGASTVKKITFKIIPDETVRLTALKTGDVDFITNVPSDDLATEMENPSSEDFILTIVPGSVSINSAFVMNTTKEPFDNVKVRQAMVYAIDAEEILNMVYKGIGEVAVGPYPEGSVWYAQYDVPDVDLEKAKELLEEAGYPDGFDFILNSTNTIASFDKVATVIQAQLAKVGVNAIIELDEFAAYAERQGSMDFDAQVMGGGLFIDPELWYGLLLHTDSAYPMWYGMWTNTEVDGLLDQARVSSDLAERQELYANVNDIVWRDVPIIWFHIYPTTIGYSTELKGVEINGRGDFVFDNNKGLPYITK